jgi:hypothetical protein
MRALPLPCALATLMLLGGCATPASRSTSSQAQPKASAIQEASRFELRYQLGHDLRILRFVAERGRVRGELYLDHEKLRDVEVASMRYVELTQKAQGFMRSRKPASEAAPCRAPYSVTLQVGERAEKASGCRLSEEGSGVGRLVRDAEVLLYGKK